MNKERIYFDNASTTNLGAEALNAMMPVLTDNYGNSISHHSFGLEAKNLVEESRKTIAESINSKTNEGTKHRRDC